MVNLNRADARFETMVLPQAQAALERGVKEGRFEVEDVPVALTSTIGGALALMRGILEERLDPSSEVIAAEGVLRSLGLSHAEAHEIANRELPEIATGESN